MSTQKKICTFLLVLCIHTNLHIVESQDDQDLNDLSRDTRNFIKTLTNDTERKIYIEFAKRKASIYTEAVPRYPLLYAFQCAADLGRTALEKTYFVFKGLKKHELPLKQKPNLEIPKDILEINRTRDEWINRIRKAKYSRSTWSLNTTFKNWYNFLHSKPENPATRRFVDELRVELDHYHSQRRCIYNGLDLLYKRFAAHTARSFSQFCAICTDLITRLKEKVALQPRRDFVDILFDIVPTWWLNREQLDFLNILIKINTPNRVYIPINRFFAKNLYCKEQGLGDFVVIPYGDIGSCGGQNMSFSSTMPTASANSTVIVQKSSGQNVSFANTKTTSIASSTNITFPVDASNGQIIPSNTSTTSISSTNATMV